jgi:peptidyl-prolyl cis-trans isomerase SurA
MEALEKAATAQGVSYEDFKNNIRNSCITKQVVGDEVGRKLQLTQAEEEAYYKAHADQFQQPEQVHLSEILVPTSETPTDAELAAAKAKADEAEAQLHAGKSFADVAKKVSGGPTASAGGDLGDFKRGTLGQVLEDATFSLPVGGVTAPIRTKQGFVILRADSHTQAGVAPLSAVEQQVQEAIYVDQLQPALRAYLTKARTEAYIDIKPGFVDTGASKAETKPVFTTYKAPAIKKKQVEHQRMEKEQSARAQQELAQAKEDAAAKAARAAAKSGGATNASLPSKPKKIHREKIRYGQAPRNALPAGTETASDGGAANSPPAGQAPGALITQGETTTVLTAGTGPNDEIAAPAGPQKKTRFSSRENQIELTNAQKQVAKAQERAAAHPEKPAPAESAVEKQQAAPLGLNGDTASKVKPAHTTGSKERLQEQQKPAQTPATPIAPTVNPDIVSSPVVLPPASSAKPAGQTQPATGTAPATPPQP